MCLRWPKAKRRRSSNQFSTYLVIRKMAFLLGVQYERVPEETEEDLQIWFRHPDQPLSLQLHSEYRSTYRWHEAAPTSAAASAAGATAASSSSTANQEVVRRPPKPSTGKKDKKYFWLFFGAVACHVCIGLKLGGRALIPD